MKTECINFNFEPEYTTMRSLSLFFLLFLPLIVFSQEETKSLYDMEVLSRKVNSRYHDSAPVISTDGKMLYFFVADHPENKMGRENSQDIWYSEMDENEEWTEAVHMKDLNIHRYNQVLTILNNGKTLLLRGGASKKAGGLSLSQNVNGKWSRPKAIKIKDYEEMKS